MNIDGKYQNIIEKWGLSQYGWRDNYGFIYSSIKERSDFLRHNLKNMRSKLEGYMQSIDIKSLTPNNNSSGNINVFNNNENSIKNYNVIINFKEIEQTINNCESLTDEETKEALNKLKELQEIYESRDSRKSKWEKAKKILAWLVDKSVDVAIAFFPTILSILSNQ